MQGFSLFVLRRILHHFPFYDSWVVALHSSNRKLLSIIFFLALRRNTNKLRIWFSMISLFHFIRAFFRRRKRKLHIHQQLESPSNTHSYTLLLLSHRHIIFTRDIDMGRHGRGGIRNTVSRKRIPVGRRLTAWKLFSCAFSLRFATFDESWNIKKKHNKRN